MTTVSLDPDPLRLISQQLSTLSEQVHALSAQVAALTEQAQAADERREVWDDLQHDVQPIVHDAYRMAVEGFAEMEGKVRLEDVVRLLKRLAGHTRTIEALLDQVESATDLVSDVGPIVHDAYGLAVGTMATAEQRGYFGFARQGAYIADRIVTSFSEEDVHQLGDNIVHILNAVKSMTQPEIMALLGAVGTNLQEVERHRDELPTGAFALMRQMRDPEVRRGLAVTLAALKAAGKDS